MNQYAVKPFLDKLPARIQDGMPSAQFNFEVNTVLGPTFVFVGCLKPKCMTIFDWNGIPTGDSLQRGDVLDDIDEFRKRVTDGTYTRHQPQD